MLYVYKNTVFIFKISSFEEIREQGTHTFKDYLKQNNILPWHCVFNRCDIFTDWDH